jgi:hypothetical protein
MSSRVLVMLAAALMPADTARGAEKEPFAIIELGGADEWSASEGTRSVGPAVAVEFEVIKEWLEIELGTATLFRRHRAEWETDLLFKKPSHCRTR